LIPQRTSQTPPLLDRQSIVAKLRAALLALGYELFDPFSGAFGKAYTQSARLFVAPVTKGWLRILGLSDESLLAPLSQGGFGLWLALVGAQEQIAVVQDGIKATEPSTALAPFLRSGQTIASLREALTKPFPAESKATAGVPLTALPEDIQALAKGVDQKRVNQMLGRFLKQMDKSSAEDQQAARALLAESQLDWNSSGGQRIRAVADCLNLPENWREPDLVTARDAYQLQMRRQRFPKALLLPGDAAALAAVPNALEYTPVYGGIIRGQ